MSYNEGLAERIRVVLSGRPGVTEKKMFGGLAFLIGGNTCCGVVGSDLMVRVGADAYDDALGRPHAREMDFTDRPLKGMVYVSAAGNRTVKAITAWIDRGAQFAGSLPAK